MRDTFYRPSTNFHTNPEIITVSGTQETAVQITEYLSQALCFSGTLQPDTDLLEEGLVDSLMIMNLVEHIRMTYGVRIAATDITPSNFRSAMAMSELVAAKQNDVRQVSMS
jgi:acyl carrier protein